MNNEDKGMARLKLAVNAVEIPDMKANIMAAVRLPAPRHRIARRLAYAATIIIALLAVSGTVMAIGGMTFEELMQRIKEPFADLLYPTTAVCEDQGIRMEMKALGYYDKMALFYVTIQDLQGDRIDENIHFNSYSIPSQWEGGDGGGSSGLVDYDAEKGIATYMFTAETLGTFDGKPFTFVGHELLYHLREWQEYPAGIDLNEADKNPQTMTLGLWDNMSGSANFEMYDENNHAYVLQPNQQIFDFPEINFARLTGIGIVDGELHVQFWQDPDLFDYDEARPYLKKANADGTFSKSVEDPVTSLYEDRVYPAKTAYFDTDANGDLIPVVDGKLAEESDLHYIEYVFDVDSKKLGQYGLFADFKKYDSLQGEWKLESQQAKTMPSIDMECDVTITDGFTVKHITMNPFGFTMEGTCEPGIQPEESKYELKTSEGIIKLYGTTGAGRAANEFDLSMQIYDRAIDIEKAEALIIDGVSIPLKMEK